jgi:hypothetical protein
MKTRKISDCKFLSWLISQKPQGLGSLLLGSAAFLSFLWTFLWPGPSIIEQLLKIQNQAKDIKTAVKDIKESVVELKRQSQRITSAIELLSTQIKELKASQVVEQSPILKQPNPTKEQIKAVLQALPNKPSDKGASIYLPKEKIDATVNSLHKAPASERAKILQDSLDYSAGAQSEKQKN